MKIGDLLYLKKYNNLILQYRELDKSISASDHTKEISQELSTFLDKYCEDLVDEALFEKLYQHYKGQKGKKNKPIIFLSSEEDIANHLIDPSFLNRLKDKVKKSVNKAITDHPVLESHTSNQAKTFKIEVISDPYSYTRLNYYFYYERKNIESLKWYRNIYSAKLIPLLKIIYDKPNINKQVNVDRFLVCSESDFDEKKCLSEVGFKNIGKLVTKLNEIVQSGQKLLADEDIILVNAIKVIQKVIDLGGVEPSILTGLENNNSIVGGTHISTERKKDEDIKNLMLRLITKSVENKDYIGFFLKDDFIRTARNRYPEIDQRRLELLFDQVVTPYPPRGVMKFEVPDNKNKITYLIAVENIPQIFDQMNIKDLKMANVISMNKQHFILFLKKLFNEYTSSKINDEKIARIMRCTSDKVKQMRSSVQTIDYIK